MPKRSKHNGYEYWALFFSFSLRLGLGAPRPSLGGQEEGHKTRGHEGGSFIDSIRRAPAPSLETTAVTKTAGPVVACS